MKSIGLIGAGLMGHGIAINIVKHGYTLTILEHAGNQPLETLKANGVQIVMSAQLLAQQCDVIILCVTGSPQVEQVLQAADGLLAGLRPGSIVIDCSTALPSSTLRMAHLVKAKGADFMDAPMTRTSIEAAQGRLNLLVGADAQVFTRCEQLLKCFAENITHAGGIGAGHQMKLLHNYVSLGMASLIAEAAACATLSGVDPNVFVDVLSKGGGGGIALERLKPFILSGDATGLRFSIANALKDLSYYNDMAAQVNASSQIAAAVKSTLQKATDQGRGQSYVPELIAALMPRAAGS
jgi:3-hydroxyisobutyrate dehydrogenase-like beta-hydroxyacid dehydrogenase